MPVNGSTHDQTLRRLVVAAGLGLVLVVALFVGARELREDGAWPGPGSDNLLLTGVFVLGALPLVVVVLDAVILARGSFKTKLFELDLASAGATRATLSVVVPANLGAGTSSIQDTASSNILAELQRATGEPVALIDLGDGQRWWESRLFIFAAGAQRRGQPDAFVFLTDDPVEGTLIGWATPADVVAAVTRTGRPRSAQYHVSLARATEAADAWAKQHATMPGSQGIPAEVMALGPPWNQQFIGAPGGHLNPHAFEQLLASDLGATVEAPWIAAGPDSPHPAAVTRANLKDLLREDLIERSLPVDASSEQILGAYLASTSAWFMVAEAGRFRYALPRAVVQDAVLQALARTFEVPGST